MNQKEKLPSSSERSGKYSRNKGQERKSTMDETVLLSRAEEKASWITHLDNADIQSASASEDEKIRQSGKLSNFYLQLRLGNAPEVEAQVQVNKLESLDTNSDSENYYRKIIYQGRIENGTIIQYVDDLEECELQHEDNQNENKYNPVITHAFLTAWVGLIEIQRGVEDGGSQIATRMTNTNPEFNLTRDILQEMIFQNLKNREGKN